ncbi:unnamed protein product [Darwinula stevensoni]|uniref:Ion transport domain-containing protein n=1 Tax=Darwinula stevensoni TaxID=69355 RepID=A0A7R8XDK3_9CRUS|nr:unnamed protein product [Darwinula stevensoni]CAG0894432.1 unnamed protein product [Darwinula stevensoni]
MWTIESEFRESVDGESTVEMCQLGRSRWLMDSSAFEFDDIGPGRIVVDVFGIGVRLVKEAMEDYACSAFAQVAGVVQRGPIDRCEIEESIGGRRWQTSLPPSWWKLAFLRQLLLLFLEPNENVPADNAVSVSIPDRDERPKHHPINLKSAWEDIFVGSLEIRFLMELGAKEMAAKHAEGLHPDTREKTSRKTLLFLAASRNDLAKVQMLLEKGADVNATNSIGNRPLHAATSAGHAACMRVLIQAGANVNAENKDYERPLHAASTLATSEPVKILLDAGADVDAINKRRETALHAAAAVKRPCLLIVKVRTHRQILHSRTGSSRKATQCSRELKQIGRTINFITPSKYFEENLSISKCVNFFLKELLRWGIGVDDRDIRGQTALHLACRSGDGGSGIVIHLLRSGADPNAEDVDFNTPVVLAANSRAEESVRYLRRFGARLTHLDATLTLARQFPRFQNAKWKKFRRYFYFNFFFYMVYAVTLTTAAVMKSYYERFREYLECIEELGDLEECEEEIPNEKKLKPVTNGLLVAVAIFAAIIILREVIQMIARKWEYFTELENLLELLLIALDVLLIINKVGSHFIDRDVGEHINAITVLLVWLEVTILIGKLPGLNLCIAMLMRVSKAFLVLLPTLICLVVGFGLSFHILFPGTFPDVPTSVYQAAVMMSGELQFYSVFFESDRLVKWSEHIIFLLFVVLMSIVMMNLMTSLAVSAIQDMSTTAEIARLSQQVHVLYHMEKVLKCDCVLYRSFARTWDLDVVYSGLLQEKKRDLPTRTADQIQEILTQVAKQDGKRQEETENCREEEDEEARRRRHHAKTKETLTSIENQIQQMLHHFS